MCLARGDLVKVHQKQGPIYSEKVLNFFQLIRSHSPKCADVVSANLFGPTNRWIQKINSKEDIPSVLEDNKATVLKRICDIIKKTRHYRKENDLFISSRCHKGCTCSTT